MAKREVRLSERKASPPAKRRRSLRTASAGRRSSMGEYLPPPGGRPLSTHALPTPSPCDYSPSTKLTLPHSPQPSLHVKPYPLKVPPLPSPCDYDTSHALVWTDKSFSLKRKDVTWPYNGRKDAHLTSGPGAGHYYLRSGDTGSAPLRSLSARHREGIHAGYPNPLVQPVDTHGFKTPGPGYRPESVRGPQHRLGSFLKKKEGETLGPGPAVYTLPSPTPPTPLIGERLYVDWDPDYPAPNHYNIPGIVGSGEAKTFGVKADGKRDRGPLPSPNTYFIRGCKSQVAHSMTYKPFPSSIVREHPGPAEYSPPKTNLPRTPQFSCRQHCLPSFPDILLYPEHTPLEVPGAGAYEFDREFQDNSHPAFSISLPHRHKPNTNPAPNRYRVRHKSCSGLPTAPSYSLGQRLPPSGGGSVSPSPAEYLPLPPSTPSASITPRRSKKEAGSITPAPNVYAVERGQTNKGRFTGPAYSMKGRPTPLQYSGFPSSHLARLASFSV